jgi:hypothetical protein
VDKFVHLKPVQHHLFLKASAAMVGTEMAKRKKETKTILANSLGNNRSFIFYLFPLSQVVQLEDLFVRKCPYRQNSPLKYLFHPLSLNLSTRYPPYEDSELFLSDLLLISLPFSPK